ncbi:hypothetical protein [Sediminibacterium soli]|uniref:hypothetical protein n=1 Tax=Sediminibacterium soli TaxID=2698829 RepID=UPI001379CC04|nr:hypothetical protein [Sediminibacterium soli]NCI46042.1 hypothetical protein [Sediminibacterium soli]
MRLFLFILLITILACGSKQKHLPAENALDAGRQFIESCLWGDFQKAAFYLAPGEKNREKLDLIEGLYRQKDKEGRQQYRLASINLHEVREISADTTLIFYSNSFDKTPDSLMAIRLDRQWLVTITDLKTVR